MTKKTRQAYQYEAPVTPSKWTGEEQRFSIRVKAVLEDLYQKFSALSANVSGICKVETVNGKGPDEDGNVALGAADVGARPNTWTPTAADVGALPVSGTAADASKLGGKAPAYYTQHEFAFSAGTLVNSGVDEVKGHGEACVLLYPNGLAEIHFVIKSTAAGTAVNNFSWGINRNLLIANKKSGAAIPSITPIAGGTCIYYGADFLLSAGMTGYGGTFERTGEFWKPARVYTTDGSVGGWPSSNFKAGYIMEGVCYGTYER